MKEVKQDATSGGHDSPTKNKVIKRTENLSVELDIPWPGHDGFIFFDMVWREKIERDEGEVIERERLNLEVRPLLELPEPYRDFQYFSAP